MILEEVGRGGSEPGRQRLAIEYVQDVLATLANLVAERGPPEHIRSDNSLPRT